MRAKKADTVVVSFSSMHQSPAFTTTVRRIQPIEFSESHMMNEKNKSYGYSVVVCQCAYVKEKIEKTVNITVPDLWRLFRSTWFYPSTPFFTILPTPSTMIHLFLYL